MPVRPIQPSDHDGIDALHREVWWPHRTRGGRRWLESNPARHDLGAPAGWIVEDETGAPAAHLGNFIQRFWRGDAALYGSTGYSLIVTPRVRGQSRGLIRAILDQPELFAFYTLNANSRACRLYAQYGLSPWPAQTHDLKLSWIIDPIACLEGRALRSAVRRFPVLSGHEWATNGRLGRMPRLRLPPGVERLTDVADGSDYDAYWNALRSEGRLIADRSPAILRWRLADPDLATPPLMLAFRRDGRIVGALTAMMNKISSTEPVVLEIIDVTALDGAGEAVAGLVRAVLKNARALGAAKVRLPVVNSRLLARLGRVAQHARREGGWGHGHALFSPDAPPTDDWSPTAFDGDYALCLRAPPLRRARTRPAGVASATASA